MVITFKPPPSTTSKYTSRESRKVEKGKTPRQEHEERLADLGNLSAEDIDLTGPQFQDDVHFSDGSPPRKSIKSRVKGRASVAKTREKPKRRKQPTTWLDFFSRLFLLSFLIYTLSVCPQADKDKSPVCRALSEYRRLVVEPYVISPFQSLLHHPSVAPYAVPIIENSKPVIARAQLGWSKHVVPQWKTRVVPLWDSQIVPRWTAHVTPQLNRIYAQVEPHRKVADEAFQQHVKPHVERIHVVTRKVQPYVLLTASKTFDSYQASKPYISKGVVGLQKVPPFLNEYVIKPLAVARRQFVDPHVALLIEKVKELSSGSAKVTTGSPNDIDPTPTPAQTVPFVSDRSADERISATSPSNSNVPGATTSQMTYNEVKVLTIADSASSILAQSLHTPEASVEGATYSPMSDIKPREPAVIVSESAIEDPVEVESVVPDQEPDLPAFTESGNNHAVVEDSVSSPSFEVVDDEVDFFELSVNTDDVLGINDMTTAPIDDTKEGMLSQASSDVGGFDQFFEDLDLDSDDEPVVVPPVVAALSAEELAAKEVARVEKIAAKRRDIEQKHSKWESELEEQMEEQSNVLKGTIQSIRMDAVQRLKLDKTIRDAVDILHDESEKALKGTEAYLKKLKGGEKVQTEQASLWGRVLNKVEKKFDERVSYVEDTVNTWYEAEVLNKEKAQFEKSYDLVRAIADEAQASLGMDYAWLDDVTANDWKRYHRLDSDAKDWRVEVASLIDGTSEKAYPNPVLNAFNDLQSEVSDITVGFRTRMRRIKREGERAFDVDQSTTKEDSPELSILPIIDEREGGGAVPDPADAILQRSQEEVAEAMERLAREPITVKHEEL